MALQYINGFDQYKPNQGKILAADIGYYGFSRVISQTGWDGTGSAHISDIRIHDATRRISGNSMYVYNDWGYAGGNWGLDNNTYFVYDCVVSTFMAAGVAVKLGQVRPIATPLLGFGYDGGGGINDHCHLMMHPNGAISIGPYSVNLYGGADNGGIVLNQTVANVLRLTEWFYVEMSLDMTTTDPTVNVYVNGKLVIAAATSSLFYNQSEKLINTMMLSFAPARTFTTIRWLWWDDIYVLDGTGDTNNDVIGPAHMRVYAVDGPVSASWTPTGAATNWEAVAGPYHDPADTSYVTSLAINDEDVYTLEDVDASIGAVVAVQVALFATASAGVTDVKMKLKNGADTIESTVTLVSTSTEYHNAIFDKAPDGVSAWDRALVNGSYLAIENV